jgi:magnesium-transporting ATPase (P-type)
MRQVHYSLLFSACLFLVFVWAAWQAYSFNELAKFFPFYIAIAGVVMTAIYVILSTVAMVKERKKDQPAQEADENEGSVLKYMIWIIGYIGFIYLIGFLSATTLFLLAFLYFESKFSILKTLIAVVITQVVIHIFAASINLYWPTGIFPMWPF